MRTVRTQRRQRAQRTATGRFLCALCWLCALASLPSCRQDMHDQPRYKPLARSAFFGDERSARPLVADTVARGRLKEDELLESGKDGKDFSAVFPFPVDLELVKRGRDRYEIYCTPCHGRLGRGDGMVVRRGFKIRPTSFHDERLRSKPAGYFFDVMSNGFGAMQDYATQLSVRDRWAVVAYLRALQRSQSATLADVPESERGALAPKAATEQKPHP